MSSRMKKAVGCTLVLGFNCLYWTALLYPLGCPLAVGLLVCGCGQALAVLERGGDS